MEKATIKVRVDDSLTFNLDVPLECDADEFNALIERAKIIYKASGMSIVREMKDTSVEMPATRRFRETWAPELEKEFLEDYMNASAEEKFGLMQKYGLRTIGYLKQKFYKLKRKYNIKGKRRKRKITSDEDVQRVIDLYESGKTPKEIGEIIGLPTKAVLYRVQYLKRLGKIKRKGRTKKKSQKKPGQNIEITQRGTEMEKILGNIFKGDKK